MYPSDYPVLIHRRLTLDISPWPAGIPQFYIACAQLSVTGGSGSFSAALKIPGHVKNTDSGYTANV